jgi:hypothetical protein
LKLEEDHRVHRRPAAPSVELTYQLPDEREVEPLFKTPVEVVRRDELFE